MRLVPTLVALVLVGCGSSSVNGGSSVSGSEQPSAASLTVASRDLAAGSIPREFTCDGANRMPRLEWGSPPSATQELAVEMLDPDAPGGTFTHWLAYGIPAGTSSLGPPLPPEVLEGVNDFGRHGYGGPCPPRGSTHHYHFILLALDTQLRLAAGMKRPDLESRIKGHVIGRGELVATYQRA